MMHPCFIKDQTVISFASFRKDVAQLRLLIRATPYQNILLFESDSYLFSVCLFSLMLENRHVLLPFNAQEQSLINLSDLCDATLGEVSLAQKPVIPLAASLLKTTSKNINDLMLNTDELWYQFSLGKVTFFTSGSTGEPKKIVKKGAQLVSELETLMITFATKLKQANIVISSVSHQHIYGLLFKILLPLKLNLIIVSQFFEYPEHIVTFLKTLEPSINPQFLLISSPAHLKRLVLDNVLKTEKNQCVAVFSSGGLLEKNVSKSFENQMGIAPFEVYGSTETGGIAWRQCSRGIIQFWRLFTGIEYQQNSEGKLVINSPYLTEQSYITDDLISVVDENYFELLGRADRTIKLEEKRVNLAHVETCLLLHLWVEDVRIITLKQNERTILAAVIELTRLGNNEVAVHGKLTVNNTLKQHLLGEFERICLPKKWRYVSQLPVNIQGKVVLADLEQLF